VPFGVRRSAFGGRSQDIKHCHCFSSCFDSVIPELNIGRQNGDQSLAAAFGFRGLFGGSQNPQVRLPTLLTKALC